VRPNFATQRFELLAEKRSHHQWHDDQILKESRRCGNALRGEGR